MDLAHLVDVGKYTTTGNGGSNEQVKLFVTSNSELQVSWGDTLHSEILGSVTWTSEGSFALLTGELEYLGGQVLQNGSDVDRCLCTNPDIVCILGSEETRVNGVGDTLPTDGYDRRGTVI